MRSRQKFPELALQKDLSDPLPVTITTRASATERNPTKRRANTVIVLNINASTPVSTHRKRVEAMKSL
jgi:hypothetical protein